MPFARRLLSLLLPLLLAAPLAHAAPETERSKAQAEEQRAGLQQKLTELKRDISRTESAKEDASDTLAESEVAISNANRSLRELADEQAEIGLKLTELAQERRQLGSTLALQQKQLAALLREHYVAGNEDRIKLLLSGDNPNRINRDLQMLTYVSQAQARFLTQLRATLQATQLNEQKTRSGKDALDDIALKEHEHKKSLEQEKTRRAALLSTLASQLTAQRKEAGNVVRAEQRMATLVDRLGQLIKEQAQAAAAAKLRQERLVAARAEAARVAAVAKAEALARAEAQARANAIRLARAREQVERARLAQEKAKAEGKVAPPFKPEPVDADEPRIAEQKAPPPPPAVPKPVAPLPPEAPQEAVVLAPAPPDGAFAALRGQLRAPVTGTVAAKFGSKRGDGPSWKGVFIRAVEGADIKAVAAGRIVFAEWLRGFGNLIIVDHGGQYMSIYGNNQTLLKRAGAVVKGGESIASAGNSGGNEESGLYFELRHQGRAFDPASWVKF